MRVEIFADVLCLWCFLGKRRLAAALARLGVEAGLGLAEVRASGRR